MNTCFVSLRRLLAPSLMVAGLTWVCSVSAGKSNPTEAPRREADPRAEGATNSTDGAKTPLATDDAAVQTKKQAEELFAVGRDLMQKGEYAAACTAFAESQRLMSRVGTLMNLALCHATQKHYATAYTLYIEAAKLATKLGDSRDAFARGEASEIEAKVQRIKIELAEADGTTTVEVAGERHRYSDFDGGFAVDPGTYELIVAQTGRQPKTVHVVVKPDTRVPPFVLEALVKDSEPTDRRAGVAMREEDVGRSRVRPWMGITTAAGGAILAATGAVLYGTGKASANGADCRETTLVCTEKGDEDRDAGAARANVSIPLMVGGGAAIVGGIVLFVLARPKAAAEGTRRVELSAAPISRGGFFASISTKF